MQPSTGVGKEVHSGSLAPSPTTGLVLYSPQPREPAKTQPVMRRRCSSGDKVSDAIFSHVQTGPGWPRAAECSSFNSHPCSFPLDLRTAIRVPVSATSDWRESELSPARRMAPEPLRLSREPSQHGGSALCEDVRSKVGAILRERSGGPVSELFRNDCGPVDVEADAASPQQNRV